MYEGPDYTDSKTKTEIVGASNKPNACLNAITHSLFISPKTCPEPIDLPHSFNCVNQPKFVTESKNILVFENFYYTSSALAVLSVDKSAVFPLLTNPKNILVAAEEMCNTEWSEADKTYPKDSQPKDTNLKLCFGASYANAFLINGLGLREDKEIIIQKEVDGSEIEWALGAVYKELASFLKATNLRHTPN